MNWIVLSMMMFVSSIVFYLSVKKLQQLGVDKRVITLANYIIPTIIFYFIAKSQGIGVGLPLYVIGLIFVLRVGFNYIGSLASFTAIELAPNAGYSLVIQKSYAVYTIFAAALLYGSELNLVKIFFAFVTLFFAFMLSVDSDRKINLRGGGWVTYSLIAFFCFGAISLSSKYFANIGVKAAPQLFWVCLLTIPTTLIDMKRLKQKVNLRFGKEVLLYMAILGISVTGLYYFKLTAEIAAPNLGYVGAINSASNAFYTLIVARVFNDTLSMKKFGAVLGMTAGMIALLFS